MQFKNKKLKSSLAGLGLTAVVAPASAQMLEEVMVTAQKREQGLGDVPLSMQVVSGDSLESQNIFDFKGLVEQLPNVFYGQSPGPATISMRGVGTGTANSAAEQSVGMYVDGIYVSRGYQFNAPFTDVERVEVLKGPQGVLQGKNSVAGAIVITTRRPSAEFEASLRADYEFENEGYNLEGVVSGPLTENISGRLVAQQNFAGGWLDTNTRLAADGETVLNGDDDQNEDEFYIVRSSLLWEASDTLSLFGKLEVGERELSGQSFGGAGIQPGAVVGGPFNDQTLITDYFLARDPNYDTADNGVVSNGFANTYDAENNVFEASNRDLGTTIESASFTGQLDWDIELGTVTAISGYSEFDHESVGAITMAPVDWLTDVADKGDGGEEFDQFTQEIRLVSPGGATIDYIVGAFYMDRTIDRDGAQRNVNLSNSTAAYPPGTDVSSVRYFNEDTDSWSLFGQLTWNITDVLRVNAGVRYTDETKEVDHDYVGEFLVENAFNQPLLDRFGVDYFTTEDLAVTKIDDTTTDPSASIQWDITDNVMLYASYTEATKAGGFNSSAVNPTDASFDPEEATGYEAGMKGAFLDGRLAANVSIFQTEFDELQVAAFDAVTSSFFFRNAAEATTEGVEADVRYALTESLEIGGALAYLDASYDDFPGASCSIGLSMEADCDPDSLTRNAAGDDLRFAPEWTGNLYAQYRYAFNNGMELGLRGDLIYSDEYYWGGQNDPYMVQDSFTKYDLTASLSSADGSWKVSVVGKNLSDETTSSFGGPNGLYDGAYWSSIDAPRQIFLTAEYRWF